VIKGKWLRGIYGATVGYIGRVAERELKATFGCTGRVADREL